jgi:hypothetical protein
MDTRVRNVSLCVLRPSFPWNSPFKNLTALSPRPPIRLRHPESRRFAVFSKICERCPSSNTMRRSRIYKTASNFLRIELATGWNKWRGKEHTKTLFLWGNFLYRMCWNIKGRACIASYETWLIMSAFEEELKPDIEASRIISDEVSNQLFQNKIIKFTGFRSTRVSDPQRYPVPKIKS